MPPRGAPASTLIDLAVFWILAAGVLGHTRRAEGLLLASIGWRSLSWRSAPAAVGIGVLRSLLVPLLNVVAVGAVIPSACRRRRRRAP